jgi:hypothetical protein
VLFRSRKRLYDIVGHSKRYHNSFVITNFKIKEKLK